MDNFRSGYVAITGLANAGKSTLLNNILGTKVSIVSSKAQTTRNNILGIKTRGDAQLVFVDTPGVLTKNIPGKLGSMLMRNFKDGAKDSDLNMLVIDAKRANKDVSAIEILQKKYKEKGIAAPKVIALNKVDLLEKKSDLLPLLSRIQELFGSDATIVPISAKQSDGLESLEEELVKLLPEGPAFFPEEMKTDQSQEFILSEIVREKLFNFLNKELPYSVAVKLEKIDEMNNLLHIYVSIIVERDSQKAIIIGRKGQKLSKIGRNARLELEKMLGKRIFLKTFVKVEPGWTKSEKGLQKVGYNI